MQQRPWGFTLALCVASSERLRSLLFSASPHFLNAAWSDCSLQMGVFGCWIIEEETPTAGHRWDCGGTGPDDQESFHVVRAGAWYIHVVSVRAILQSGCMEVIWVHLGVQTGYIVNTQ